MSMGHFTAMGLSVTGGVQRNLRREKPGVIVLLISVPLLIVITQLINKRGFLSGVLKTKLLLNARLIFHYTHPSRHIGHVRKTILGKNITSLWASMTVRAINDYLFVFIGSQRRNIL